MSQLDVERLQAVKTFPSLVKYLRDELEWPIDTEDVEDLTFDYEPEELGIDPKTAAKIQEIKQLRPLDGKQPWGIFFVKFEPKRLPVVVLRKVLNQLVIKKRAAAGKAMQAAWHQQDLLFISSYGEQDQRHITFAHFTQDPAGKDLPTLKVLGWDGQDTVLHVDAVVQKLKANFRWPRGTFNPDQVREQWSAAFTYRHREVITTSKELAQRLAELARNIRHQVLQVMQYETDKGPIRQLFNAFRAALIHDLDADGFADMYAQTIAYGLLSARIADPTKTTLDDFAAHMRTNPFLRELMETFLRIGGRNGKAGGPGIDFDELGVSEVVALLDQADMEAVVRDFGDRNPTEDPVIHFYEHFLAAYDKQLKVSRGVFYTPQPVVSYIVRSVHELLQMEFGLEDGLADTTTWGEMLKKHPGLNLPLLTDEPGEKRTISPDEPFIQILDPATGTATFLVEVIEIIHQTLQAKWIKQRLTEAQQLAAWNEYVPKHLLPRLHGYELMMAPYAIAHMKVGLKLTETGYRFGKEERARIFLTNALEPWVKQPLLVGFDALAHEASAVNEIKRHKRFTVVIGNPPYSKLSSNLTAPVRALIEPYKYFDGVRIREKGALQFEMNLQDDYIKFVRLVQLVNHNAGTGITGFICNRGFLDNPTLRGMRWSLSTTYPSISLLDLRGHQSTMEDGTTDENVFDIKQGVAIALAMRPLTENKASVRIKYSSIVGSRRMKYQRLSSFTVLTVEQSELQPKPPLLKFVPTDSTLDHEFTGMISLTELFPQNGAGFISSRDGLVINESRHTLEQSIVAFGKDAESESEIYSRYGFGPSKRLDLRAAQRAVRNDRDVAGTIRPCLYRPFDQRWVYYRRELIESFKPIAFNFSDQNNIALLATRQVTRSAYEHVFVSRCMGEIKVCSHDRNTQIFPLFLQNSQDTLGLSSGTAPNLDLSIMEKIATRLGLKFNPSCNGEAGECELSPLMFFNFTYAILHCPTYRERYFGHLRSEFPRLPLPGNLDLFRTLSRLGGELTALHLLESPQLAQPISEFIGGRHFEIEKISWSANTVWIDRAQTSGFNGVPEKVWNFHIGGYQVCEKWLKDRKGRVLSEDHIAHYQKVLVALSETIRLMAEIDEVIEARGGWPGAFATGD